MDERQLVNQDGQTISKKEVRACEEDEECEGRSDDIAEMMEMWTF